MTIITLPANLPIGAGSGMGQRRYDQAGGSETTGSEQARVIGPPRWTLQLLQPQAVTLANAGRWQALIMKLRGKVNRLAAWDPVRTAPAGTLRGTLTLSGAHALGATTLVLTGSTGTLLAGDLLQVGTGIGTSQLVMVTDDCTQASVPIEPPLRLAQSSGVAVTWDHPLAYFRHASDGASWSYGPAGRVVTGMSLDLIEVWA